MVKILPFRGLRYNLDKLQTEGASLSAVATPPYDVINAAQQEIFYAQHPANFVRVDLGRKTDQDNARDNPYTRADAFLKQWEQEGTLISEAQPAVYAYSQSWTEDGRTIERKGVIVLLQLEDFESGKVLPHEFTLKGPKEDRIQLMRQTLMNLSQVFLIYSDPQRRMEALLFAPNTTGNWAEATDADGVAHRFRPVTDGPVLDQLQGLFADKTLLIADGHHRYETALAYQREVREQVKRQTGQEPPAGSLLSDYGMVFLTNMDDPGLKVYPTHRILYQWPQGWDQARFEAELFARFDEVDTNETFRYRPAGQADFIKLKVKPNTAPQGLFELLATFDAAILEGVVFKGILQQPGEALKQSGVLGFYRDEAEIDNLWHSQHAVAGFYLAAPSVKLVHQICESGHRMPQKSTYFYPKILSGLVLYPYRKLADGQNALSGVIDATPVEAGMQNQAVAFSQRPY